MVAEEKRNDNTYRYDFSLCGHFRIFTVGFRAGTESTTNQYAIDDQSR